jgi:endonuclease/exonuclease/phosphatase family metal-dependent hydrolase
MEDSREVSEESPYGPEGTFEDFDYEAPLKGKLERDDYIFVSKKIKVLKYGVLTDSYNCKFPSDHLPVVAKVVIN